MNYVKINIKNKICNVTNIVIITIISIIILLIIFNNLKIYILFNHKYYPNIMFIDVNSTNNKNLFSNIEKKIELIKKENINYSKEELNQIIKIIETNFDKEQNIYNKEYYTFDDIKKILYTKSNDVNDILKLTIYNNGNKIITWNNEITNYIDSYYDYERNLKYFINNCYKYNYTYNPNIDESIGNQVKQYLNNKYSIYSIILENIITGGDTNE